ncbi:MAG: HEAT repeat domain-containing protein [FCB group bacterium]|jgi:HEAT repeat protein
MNNQISISDINNSCIQEVKHSPVTDLIDNLLYHTDSSIRRNAAIKLSDFEFVEEKIINALVLGLKDSDRGVRDVCTRALSNPLTEFAGRYAEMVSPLIADKNIETRNLAAEIMKVIGEKSTNAILPYTKFNDADVRQFAVEIIGAIRNGDEWYHLIDMLNDENPNVRNAVIEALGNMGIEDTVGILIGMYEDEDELKPTIIESLGKIGGSNALDFLSGILSAENDILIKMAVIDSLASIGDNLGICEVLLDEIQSVVPELQVYLLKTICTIANRLGKVIVFPGELRYIAQRALYEEDIELRNAGLVALGNKYTINDIEALIKEVSRNNSDTQQLILNNLLVNCEFEVIIEFFTNFSLFCEKDDVALDLISQLPFIWDSIPYEVRSLTIGINTGLVFSSKSMYNIYVLEILFNLDSNVVFEKMLEIIPELNNIQLETMIEAIRKFADPGLPDVLDNMDKVVININKRVKNILETEFESHNL